MRAAASIAWERLGEDLFAAAAAWESDTARGWAAFAVPLTGKPVDEQLDLANRFAADRHFAVLGNGRGSASAPPSPRTWNRPCGNSAAGSGYSERPFVRRFTVEVTRPRGVWSAHIPALKANPGAGLAILDVVVADANRYVRDSVANWLNDARKSQPHWVADRLASWQSQHGADQACDGSPADAAGRMTCDRPSIKEGDGLLVMPRGSSGPSRLVRLSARPWFAIDNASRSASCRFEQSLQFGSPPVDLKGSRQLLVKAFLQGVHSHLQHRPQLAQLPARGPRSDGPHPRRATAGPPRPAPRETSPQPSPPKTRGSPTTSFEVPDPHLKLLPTARERAHFADCAGGRSATIANALSVGGSPPGTVVRPR